MQVVDVGSGVLASFDGGNLRSDASVVSFGLAPNQQYVAAESTIRATGRRSVLMIFQADGTRLYEEVFASAYLALAARPSADQTESLLVGAGSRVWNLRVKPPAANE